LHSGHMQRGKTNIILSITGLALNP